MNGITYIAHKDGDELAHYGVKGQKWGVRRVEYKTAQNQKLFNKVNNLDKKAANLTKKSEKYHSIDDLGRSNKYAAKAASYRKKAASVIQKSSGVEGSRRDALLKKAAVLNYKADYAQIKANRISKTKGYGLRAMKYSIKSDRMRKLASKGRVKLESNTIYINAMQRKLSQLNPKDEEAGK